MRSGRLCTMNNEINLISAEGGASASQGKASRRDLKTVCESIYQQRTATVGNFTQMQDRPMFGTTFHKRRTSGKRRLSNTTQETETDTSDSFSNNSKILSAQQLELFDSKGSPWASRSQMIGFPPAASLFISSTSVSRLA
mmetsp:Transcript_2164/g.7894  ORF Transcript_2164/g.7894 Transcript_2164/m.7894 type:complete len:140 (-) Transcript_2164:3760-4179(-)